METTHWADLAENFKIQDAACLMAGVPPAKEIVAWSDQLPPEARYVFERLWKAYMRGAGVYKQPELNSADFQKMLHGIDANYFQAPTIVPARGAIRRQNMLIAPSAELMRKRLERVRVSREELHRWVQATGIKSAYQFAPVGSAPSAELSTQPEQRPTKPAPTLDAMEPARDVPASMTTGPEWKIKRPTRFQGYGKPLYDFLKAAHTAGKPRPSARDFLDGLKSNRPPDVVEVTDNGLKYYDAQGSTKPADLEAIRKTIARMTG